MMMNKSREDCVREFALGAGQPLNVISPSADDLEFRYSLILEEVRELGEEVAYAMAESVFKNGIPVKVKARMLKELADIQYVVSGFAEAFGLNLEVAFNRVHKSNMSKFDEHGRAIFNDKGKVLKGPSYVPPELEDLIISEDN